MITRALRALQLRAADLADVARGRRDALTPPRRYLDFVGDSDFQATGEEFLEHFRTLAGLQPADRVLDVGCGIGRMARVLTRELQPPGAYDGFDISRQAIEWCRRHYVRLPVPFTFTHADLVNSLYNPGGGGAASDYHFPYLDHSFDLVIATSVFTHLLADAVDNYLAQAARVLAPGGRLFVTWFLVCDDRPPAAADAAVVFSRGASDGVAQVADPAVPEAAVAYPEPWLRSRLAEYGLRVREPIRYGSWRGRDGLSFQDIVVAERGREG
jgi:SAM-dependent methyltransferase